MKTGWRAVLFVVPVVLLLVELFPITRCAAADQAAAPGRAAVLSIVPASGEPGADVMLYGSGFSDGVHVWLGTVATKTRVSHPHELAFQVPDLAPGTYAMFLKRSGAVVSRVYNFSVLAKTPLLESLDPDRLTVCGDDHRRELQVNGKNFVEQTQVLLDGAVIRSRFQSSESLVAKLPPINGGMHSIQLKNPGGTLSSPLALFMDSRPQVTAVSQGEQFVNYYQLIIEGRNFLRGSQVVVDGRPLSAAAVNPFDREKVLYDSCSRLIYQRHPYDSNAKNFTVQVLNPNGEESEVVQVVAP
jgi:hypothetical protein